MKNMTTKNDIEVTEVTKLLEQKRNLFEIEKTFQEQMDTYNNNLVKFKDIEEQIKAKDTKIQ